MIIKSYTSFKIFYENCYRAKIYSLCTNVWIYEQWNKVNIKELFYYNNFEIKVMKKNKGETSEKGWSKNTC